MISTSQTIEKAIATFAKLPSIGRKSAQRLVYFLLRQNPDYIEEFIVALSNLKSNVKLCKSCYNYSDDDICPICASNARNSKIICVVEEPKDVFAIEKTNEFRGVYHVLHGLINPIGGVNASDLKIKELIERVPSAEEVILALSPSVEGEVTSQYIAKLIKPLNIRVTRIASGLPVGSSLEWTDEATLSRALEGRIAL
ncbi:MAG TPA: recombination mediator RecR [Candidatus Kapabacteria bacterium]|jgi:recombination protein RecR|nr:recombination mediator RecR [Candidatus Kapabacteria bacterium]HOM05716.1 recombination mediator RecR [Candidatus Kapabacteria bacterium]HPP39544.1 recombination mediator RecR [Candidatus Kapabacteria bacterium]